MESTLVCKYINRNKKIEPKVIEPKVIDCYNLRKERQMDGIKANKDKFKGRGQTIDVDRIKALKGQGMGATAIAKEMGIDRTSVYRLLKNK